MGKNLRNGRSKSCGCYHSEKSREQITHWNKIRPKLDLTGQKYGLLTPIEITKQYYHGSTIWKCQCDCGNIAYLSVDQLRGQHPIRSCGCLGQSYGEKAIETILIENNIPHIKEYAIPEMKQKRYDFAIIDNNNQVLRLIEFDGEQHYKTISNWDPLEVQQKRDKEKNEWAKAYNIPLVRIPYWERNHITLDLIMGDKYLLYNENVGGAK